MQAIDIRDNNWKNILERVTGEREIVYRLWQEFGPATNRELAQKSSRDLLSIAPRTTELLQLGLLELIGQKEHRGIYQAIDLSTAQQNFERHRAAAMVQPELPLKEG